MARTPRGREGCRPSAERRRSEVRIGEPMPPEVVRRRPGEVPRLKVVAQAQVRRANCQGRDVSAHLSLDRGWPRGHRAVRRARHPPWRWERWPCATGRYRNRRGQQLRATPEWRPAGHGPSPSSHLRVTWRLAASIPTALWHPAHNDRSVDTCMRSSEAKPATTTCRNHTAECGGINPAEKLLKSFAVQLVTGFHSGRRRPPVCRRPADRAAYSSRPSLFRRRVRAPSSRHCAE